MISEWKNCLFVATVGPSADPVLKGLLGYGLREGDSVLLVYSEPGGAVEDVEVALQRFKAAIGLEEVKVSCSSLVEDVSELYGKVAEMAGGRRVVGLLSGGACLLTLEVLTALSLYRRVEGGEVVVSFVREDGSYAFDLPLSLITDLSLSPSEELVLSAIPRKGRWRKKELISSLKGELSRSTVYNSLDGLKGKGLIVEEGGEVRLTDIGRLMVRILKKGIK